MRPPRGLTSPNVASGIQSMSITWMPDVPAPAELFGDRSVSRRQG